MVTTQDDPSGRSTREVVKKRLADAEAKLRRFQTVSAAGVDPTALVDAINETEEQWAAASAELKYDKAKRPSV